MEKPSHALISRVTVSAHDVYKSKLTLDGSLCGYFEIFGSQL